MDYTFDEAAQAAGNGRFQLVLLLVNGFALLNVVSEGVGMALALPAARCELDISTSEQGLINAVAFIGVVMTSHFWGFMSDTWGRKKVLQVALGGGFVFSAVSSVSVNSAMLLATRFCVGLCISGVMSAAVSYLGEFHSNKTRTRHVTIAAMFMTMAAVYQALMGLFILPTKWEFSLFGLMIIRSWRVFLFISSCTGAITFLALCFLPESPKFELAMNRNDEAVRIFSVVYETNGLGHRKEYPVIKIRAEKIGSSLSDVKGVKGMLCMVWKQTKPLFHKEHVGYLLMLCLLTFLTFTLGHGFYMWLPQTLALYFPVMDESMTFCEAVELGLANTAAVTNSSLVTKVVGCHYDNEPRTYYVILAIGISLMAALIFTAFASAILGIRNILIVWLIVNTVVTFSLIFTRNFYLNISFAAWMMSSGSIGGILSGLAADFFPTHIKGVALCFVMMFGRLGAVFGSNLIGFLLNAQHCNWIFGVFAGILVPCTFLTYYVLWKKDQIKT